jgi:flagellar biosynthesis protein FlhB
MMAQGDTGQEKTLEPTPKRIREEHEKGNFARSKDISSLAGFLASLLFLWLSQEYILNHLIQTGAFFLRFDSFLDLTPTKVSRLFWLALGHAIPLLLPFFAVVLAVGVGIELAQIGVHVVKDPFEPKWDRLNPAAGFKRLFSLRNVVEGLKSIFKLVIFTIMVYVTVKDALPEIVQTMRGTPRQTLLVMTRVGLVLGFRTCMLLALLAGADYFYQRWQYYKNLRMTHQEYKEELKQTEGDPVLKARMRSIQMEAMRKRMMTDVPKSDVVVVNPTHYAVALRYEPEKDQAPIVVAKGQNYLAQRIREIAETASVPVVENPPLARALYKQVDVGKPVPAALFKAVAQVLASIWKLAQKRGRDWAKTRARAA